MRDRKYPVYLYTNIVYFTADDRRELVERPSRRRGKKKVSQYVRDGVTQRIISRGNTQVPPGQRGLGP